MSNRTLVELNHDYRPLDDPEKLLGWARAIRTFMASGNPKHLPRGVEFKNMRHHSEPCPLEKNCARCGRPLAETHYCPGERGGHRDDV